MTKVVSKSKQYEYVVHGIYDADVVEQVEAATREEARSILREFKDVYGDMNAHIVQQTITTTQKVIR